METPKKINLLILSPWKGDWDLRSIRSNPENAYLLTGFHRAGFFIHLIFPMDGKKYHTPKSLYNFFPHPVRIPHFPQIRRIRVLFLIPHYIIINLKMIKEGAKLIHQKRIDVIYGFSSYIAPAIFVLGKIYRKPTLLKLYGVYFLLPFKWFSLRYYIENFPTLIAFFLSFDKLIIKDDGTQGDIVAKRFKIPKEKFLFWKSPVNKKWARRKRAPEEETIIAIGNLMRFKGFDLAIKAMPKITKEIPCAKLLIIGEGPEKKNLQKMVAHLGLKKNVYFWGAQKHTEIFKHYTVAATMIATNRISNLTRPVEEAMICGIPVVATNVRDTSKIIKNGKTGLLAKSEPEDIAKKVLLLWGNKELYKKVSKNAKRFALSYFPSWEDRIKEEVILIYSLCL